MRERVISGTVSEEAFELQVTNLRISLLKLQQELRGADFPLVVALEGDDRPGANETLNTLYSWMDPRYLEVHAYGKATTEQLHRPFFFRYWRYLPRRGQTGFFMRAWTMTTLHHRLREEIDEAGFERRLRDIVAFEQALVADGALLLKFWLHLPEEEMRSRLAAAHENPGGIWDLEPDPDRPVDETYRQRSAIAEAMVAGTDKPATPWSIIDSSGPRHRLLTVAQTLRERLKDHLERRRKKDRKEKGTNGRHGRSKPKVPDALGSVDLSRALGKDEYERVFPALQERLGRLSHQAHARGQCVVFVFEGWDAAGKGGAIRRMTAAMDAIHYRVYPIAAPTEEELAQHYLWRFWRKLPRSGQMAIFDRSWYGRVLVERIEGFAREEEWARAYDEINDFERQLLDAGIVLLKFWIHIDPDEQLNRFNKRLNRPHKKHKMTDEDYRNREKWGEYAEAINEMVARTGTPEAPWHLVAGNNKRQARTEIITTTCEALEVALGNGGGDGDSDPGPKRI